ncbi:MAG: creatininase family protein [Rhizobiaceae bacterium]
MLPPRNYSEIGREGATFEGAGSWVAVLPLGATEQHGPHLPIETDLIIAEGIAHWLSNALPAEFPITFLPAEPVGYSPEHLDYEGTKSLGYDEAIRRWTGIGENLFKQGITRLMFLNAHGGNSPLLSIVATELRTRFPMLCVATSWTRFGVPDGLIDEEEKALGIHGGDIETSVMLALSPDLVDMTKAEDFTSNQKKFINDYKYLRAYGPHAMGWKMQDLNPSGVVGNATLATAEKGELLLAHSVSGLCKLAEDMVAFDPALFSEFPKKRS